MRSSSSSPARAEQRLGLVEGERLARRRLGRAPGGPMAADRRSRITLGHRSRADYAVFAHEGRGAGGRDRGAGSSCGGWSASCRRATSPSSSTPATTSWSTACTSRPDLDSVTYWLAGSMDRERGWGRAGETFRATEELRRARRRGGVVRAGRPRPRDPPVPNPAAGATGESLSRGHRRWSPRGSASPPGSCPMTDDPVTTRIDVVDDRPARAGPALPGVLGAARRARTTSRACGSRAPDAARPAPGVLEAIAAGRRDRLRARRTPWSRSGRSWRSRASARRSQRDATAWSASRRSSAARRCGAWPTG